MIDLSNENVIHIKKNGIEYLQFRKLLEYSDVLTHCFTLKPLDFSDNSNYETKKDIVTKNYNMICKELGINYKNIVRPYQTHTNVVKEVNEENGIFVESLKNVDGLITSRSNRILSLTFADCTPIYLFDPKKQVIGNIHSGWKGTVQKIAKMSIEKMVQIYNCNPKDIICAIGPTIRKCHFEVEDDVKDLFYNEFNYINDIIEDIGIVRGKHRYLIDTVKINKEMLIEMGIKKENIIDSNICTVCKSDFIHSYRKEMQASGRNTAIIMLK